MTHSTIKIFVKLGTIGIHTPDIKKSPPWACHLVAVVELVCLSDPNSYAGGDLVPGGFNCAGLVEG